MTALQNLTIQFMNKSDEREISHLLALVAKLVRLAMNMLRSKAITKSSRSAKLRNFISINAYKLTPVVYPPETDPRTGLFGAFVEF